MIKAVIFDLDGTLMNTLQDLCSAINAALRTNHYDVQYTVEETKSLIGCGTKVLCQRAIAQYVPTAEKVEKLFFDFSDEYRNRQLDDTVPYPYVKEALLTIKRMGIKIAVLSNKVEANTRAILAQFFEEDFFDIIRGQRKDIPLKPDPTGVLLLIKELGVASEEVLYVGDSDTDMKTADNACLRKVAVSWGYRDISLLETYHPDYVINDIRELTEIVKNK